MTSVDGVTGKSRRPPSSLFSLAILRILALPLALAAGSNGCNSGSGTGGGTGATGGAAQIGTGGAPFATGGSGDVGPSGSGGSSAAGGQGGIPTSAPGAGGRAGGSGGTQSMTTDGGTDSGAASGGQSDGGDDGGGGGRGGEGPRDGGAPNFAPCPTNGGACVVLPLGDSITDGFPFENGGYRVELFHQATTHGRRMTFVGSLANGPPNVDSVPFPRNHEGHSGFTIANAPAVGRTGISGASITDAAIASYKPNIILLMIGTNDIDLGVDVVNAPSRLATLLDEIIRDAPNALLAVAQLTPTRADTENVRLEAYNGTIPGLVQQRASAGKHVLLVNMYGSFTANASYKTIYLNDNLHPNATGYAIMGQTWYAAIEPYLP